MNFLKSSFLLILVFFTACFPKEEAIPAVERLNKSQYIDAGINKNLVSFYSLETSEIIAEADPMLWDLYVDEDVVRINYFRSMRVAEVNKSWHEIEDTVGLKFRYLTDDPLDGIGLWELDTNQVYIVDYGLDNNNQPIGFEVLRVERLEEAIRIWHTPIGVDYEVYQDVEAKEFYYSVRDSQMMNLPLESEYDVAFGKYTQYVTIGNESQYYTIYGAILGDASAYLLNEPFDSVSAEMFETRDLQTRKNIIGWDWKNFILRSNAYEIEEKRTYMINTRSDFRCKLRFVDFYNSTGESGHTTFEYQLF